MCGGAGNQSAVLWGRLKGSDGSEVALIGARTLSGQFLKKRTSIVRAVLCESATYVD
jgi:hypothetical protein